MPGSEAFPIPALCGVSQINNIYIYIYIYIYICIYIYRERERDGERIRDIAQQREREEDIKKINRMIETFILGCE